MGIGPDGNLYVVDTGNNRVEVFDTSGTYLNQFGSFGSGDGQLNGPSGVAFGYNIPELHFWEVYVTDSGNNRIEAFGGSFGGAPQSYPNAYQYGSLGNGSGQFNDPSGIAWDLSRNELFVADTNNNRIQVYEPMGNLITSLTSAAGSNFNHALGISADLRGDVYVADTGNNRIAEFDVNTTRSTFFGTAGSGNGQLSDPYGVTVSPTNGQVYVEDTGNSRVERFGSPWLKNDTVGIYRPSTKTFYLRNSNSTGPDNIVVPMPYALAGDLPIVGDWNGDGVDTVGLYRPSTGNFLLQDANVQESAPDYAFTLGVPGDTPIAGDWNGDGSDGAGIFRPSNGILYLKNTLSTGYADNTLVLGIPGDKGIAGDWNGDGQDSPGVYRPSSQTFYVSNKVTNGIVYSDATAILGISGDVPFTGDWAFQGSSGIGVFRPSNGITYEKNAISTGYADNFFMYGIAGDVPVAGQWEEPTVTFSKPAPHVSLGSHTSSSTPHPASGGSKPAPTYPASTGHAPAATPRRSGRQ